MLYSIDDTIINSPEAEAYFDRADRRVAIGFRATLEMLGIAVPQYASRRKPGRTPALEVMAAFHADHAKPDKLRLAPRRPNVSPAIAIAASTVAGPGLFDQAFG